MKLKFDETEILESKEKFREKTRGDGKRGPFYNKTQKWIFDIKNDTLYFNAVWQEVFRC